VEAATINKSICIATLSKTLSGVSVPFWGFSDCSAAASVPGPIIEIGSGDTVNVNLSPMAMGTMEAAPYMGHTIHLHGADVQTMEDGVPETNGNMVMGDTYTWSPSVGHEGSYMYHCHVHTVKHLEMGLYSAIIVRPKDAGGNFLNRLTPDITTAYDYSQTYVLSAVDPAYHSSSAVGDSPVFADYNPAYFLITGNEGKTTAAPAMTLAAAVNKKVAFRLIGLHSVNSTFQIKNSAGSLQRFTVYIRDGRKLSKPKIVTSLDISPGQRADLIATLPATTGIWYPQVTYKKLRDNSAYSTVYGKVTF
jgi:FtsP/CotA-like multicopper oxidase with cupredoxin domain